MVIAIRDINESVNSYELWRQQRSNERLGLRLARHIVSDIVKRNLQPGDGLPNEAEMCRAYRVSRATTREALLLLDVQGLITVKPGPGGGPVVKAPIMDDFARSLELHLQVRQSTYAEVLEARLVVEPLMTRFAASNERDLDCQELRRVMDDAETIDVRDSIRFEENLIAFHDVIMAMSGNSVLNLIAGSLRCIYHRPDRTTVNPMELRLEVAAAHRKIGMFVLDHRPKEAEDAMKAHMRDYALRSFEADAQGLEELVRWC